MELTGETRRAVGWKRRLERFLWIRLNAIYQAESGDKLTAVKSVEGVDLLRVTEQNYWRVKEFRESCRAAEYRDKILRGQLGHFAEVDSRVVGSIWSTMNLADRQITYRSYMTLEPGEVLIHDIVTDPRRRGRSIGPDMTQRTIEALLSNSQVQRVIIDVSLRNKASMRMMEKIGLKKVKTDLFVSVLGENILRLTVGGSSS